MRRFVQIVALGWSFVMVGASFAQAVQNGVQTGAKAAGSPAITDGQHTLIPFVQPTLTPQVIELLKLESNFSESVAAGGGKAFASWFADDGITLGNGEPPVVGRAAIAASAQWEAKDYQLTWVPNAAVMGPSNDMGYTWGHYTGLSHDAHGNRVVASGRYLTIWKKMPDKSWKVVLESSAQEPGSAPIGR